jgi:hypothetical protein
MEQGYGLGQKDFAIVQAQFPGDPPHVLAHIAGVLFLEKDIPLVFLVSRIKRSAKIREPGSKQGQVFLGHVPSFFLERSGSAGVFIMI